MQFSRFAATIGIFVLSATALAPSVSASPKHKSHNRDEASKSSKASSHKRSKKSGGDTPSSLVHHALVRVSTAKLRSAPGENSHATALLDEGRSAKVIAKRDGWAKIRLDSGREGWVRHDLLDVNKKAVRDHSADSAFKRTAKNKPATKKHREVAAAAPKQFKKHVVVAAAPKPVRKSAQKAAHLTAVSASTARAALAAQAQAAKKHQQNLAAQQSNRQHALSAQNALHNQRLALAALHAAKAKANADANHLARLAAQQARVQKLAQRRAVQNAAALAALDHAKESREARAADATDGESTIAANITDARGDRLVRNALSYRGTPYRMGATGRGAFDCSGFTMYLFSKEGESLPRTAAEQFNHGTPVDKSDMQIGDLVFFKNTYKHGVSHVGVYIGNGHFVHASSGSHQVTVTSLSESYYVNHWAGARRPR